MLKFTCTRQTMSLFCTLAMLQDPNETQQQGAGPSRQDEHASRMKPEFEHSISYDNLKENTFKLSTTHCSTAINVNNQCCEQSTLRKHNKQSGQLLHMDNRLIPVLPTQTKILDNITDLQRSPCVTMPPHCQTQELIGLRAEYESDKPTCIGAMMQPEGSQHKHTHTPAANT